ncbi:TAXI family TRAP transporter solute-binding subunit [Antricoccus suffuscus]|nr:TAXI family TRAP transporter solute-binding subunit [Antricoccus suffuscus]
MNPLRKRRTVAALALVAACGLTLSACGGKQEAKESAKKADGSVTCDFTQAQYTIATGNSTGVYYVMGGGIANLINDNSGGKVKATAAETGASVQNIQQLGTKQFDIAFSLADTAADAVNGKGAFEGQKQDIQSLGRIYANYTQVVVRKDAGIKSVADMKGKTISTGSPKSGTEVIATRLIEAAGLNIDSDLNAQRLDLGKTVDSMKDGSIDGFVWSGGLPTPALTDLFTSKKDEVEFLDITPLLPKLKKVNDVYDQGTIPADTYGLASDVKTVVVPNVLVVRGDFADNNACAITKLIMEKKSDLAKVHPAANEFDPKTATKTGPIELNAGSKQALEDLSGK